MCEFLFRFFWGLWFVPAALEAVAWCVWRVFVFFADGCIRISEWFRKRARPPPPRNSWANSGVEINFDVFQTALQRILDERNQAPPMDVRQWNFPRARMVDEIDQSTRRLPRPPPDAVNETGRLAGYRPETAPRTDTSIVFGIHDVQKVRRLVREMGEHLEEHSEKGFVRDGAYDQLYRDLMAIRAATLPEDLSPHLN